MRQAASCPTPENVHTVNVLADEATVAWDNDELFSYAMVYYGTTGFSTDTAWSIYVADTNEVTFTSLMPNTEYEYYVVTSCAMGDANPTPRYSFRTTCAAVPADSLPYMEDFESYGTGTSATIDPCWTKYYSNTGTSTSYPYPYGTTPATGTRSLYFYSASSYYSYAALPMFESDINALRVRFNLKAYSTLSTSYGTTLVVGVMSNPNDIATFDTVEVVTFDMNNAVTNTVYPCEVSFDGYTGQGRYIAFLAPLTGPLSYTTNYAKLDDIIVDSVPDCRRCYNLVAENVTANSADLVWQNTSGNLTSYTVALSTTPNFNPDTCTNLFVVYDTIYNLSGLANYSQYYWAVRANCGSDSSDWTLVNSFRTLFDCGDNYVNILDTIGDGTTSTSTYTMYTSTSYPSGYSANLFTVAELAEMGLTSNNNINAISLHTGATGGLVQDVRIYMSETSYEGFTTSTPATDTAELFSGMTLVYQGDVTFAANQWNEIVFDTPFHYSGSNNLFVRLVRGNSAAAVTHYYTSTTPDYSTVYGYRSATGSTYTATRSYYRTNMAFNVCAEIPACERPTNVALTSLQPTGCAITWQGATPSYEVAYGPEGFNPDTVASLAGTHANTVDTTFAIVGLNPQTSYDVYVRGFCSSGDTSDWAIALNFATPCAAQTLPYTEDFETYTSGSANPISPCWTKGTNNSTQYPYPYTTNAINGNLSLYFYAYHPSSATSTAYYCYAALPLMDAPVDTLMLTFNMRRYNTTTDYYTSRLVVGVMVDPNDISTFQPVDTIDLKSEAGLSVHRIEVAFDNYTGNGSYIALYDEVPPLYGSNTYSYSYVYVDDIMVDYIPSCYTPVDLYADNVTATTADIHWTDRNSNVYGWELEYGPSGFTLGTGTVVYPVADSITLTGLVNATYYDVYVRNICSPTDTSSWTNVCTFSTECGMINTLPYRNDFENEVAGGASITTYPTFVNCWTRFNNSTSASYQGYPFVSSTASYVHEGNRCMYFYAAATSTTTAYPDIQMAILPQIDTTLIPVNTLSLNFWARRNASYPATTFYIGVMSNPADAGTFQCVDSLTPAAEYTYYEVPFNGFIGHGSYIAMRLDRGATVQYVYLDDVELDIVASCARPDTLTFDSASSNSIQLSWYEAGEASQWAVEYGPVGFVPGTGVSVIANTNPYTLTGLTPATTYQYYVRSICGVGDTSRYSRVPVTFSTAQIPGMLPYVYNFEDQGEWNNWQTNSNQSVNWFRGTAEHFDGTYGMYISADNGATCGTNMSAIVNACAYRDIDFGNDANATFAVTFKAKVGGTVAHNYDGVSVLVVDPSVPVEASSTAITSPWGHVNDVSLGTARRDTNWNTYTFHFDHQEGVRRVVFYWFNQATGVADFTGGPAAIDSVYVYQEACDRPYDLNATNITPNSANLSWSADANGTYIVAYRVNGAAASTTVYDTVVNQTNYSLTGLISNTQYVFWVKRICDATHSSDYSLSRTFTTACSYFSASDTLFEDFRSVPGVAYNIDGSLPACWEGYTNGVYTYSMPHVVNSGTYWYSLGDSNALIMTSGAATSYGDTKIVRLPLFVEPVNTLTLSYWMCTESSTNGVLSVGYMTGDNYETDFVPVKNIPASAATVKGNSGPQTGHGIFDTVTFEEVPATAQYIAFRWVYNTSFYSCCIDDVKVTSEGCSAPAMVNETHTYDSITINWAGASSLYMVNIKESTEAGWPEADTLSNVNTYTFTGLQSGTSYQIRLCQYCSYSDEWSEWVYYTISTDTLPCLTPDNLHTTDLTNATATMDWNVNGVENNWDIHVWFTGGLDTLYRVNSHPATIDGFTAGVTYNAAVRALCGNTLEEGDWSDTITFTTPTCPDVTGLATSDVTSNSVTLSWDADNRVQNWIVEYGYAGFTQGQGISDTISTNTYVVTGLTSETSYEFKVLAVCGYDWYSEQWAEISATTLASSIDDCDPVTNLVVSNITTNSAMVTWFSESGTTWNVVVPEANVDVTVTEQQYALTGLLANTNYNVKVRTVCDNDQYSDFVTTSFMTEQEEGIDGVETMNCTIYPNPTSSTTTISVSGVNGKVKIAIVDMNGRTVASETMECASDCVKTMDVENLAQGAYFVRITGESVNMVKKLVVR